MSQGLQFLVGNGGVCVNCGSESTTYNHRNHIHACESCEYVWQKQQEIDFGSCCICWACNPTVRNVITVHLRAPVPGTGWGCIPCNLPHDGAIAIICDQCVQDPKQIKKLGWVVYDFPYKKQRLSINVLTEPFDHKDSVHQNPSHQN